MCLNDLSTDSELKKAVSPNLAPKIANGSYKLVNLVKLAPNFCGESSNTGSRCRRSQGRSLPSRRTS